MQIETGQGCPYTQIGGASCADADRPLDILLVEDDPVACRALELALGHMGHLVMSARSAADAVALLDVFKIDLVISDHRLPDGTSDDVLKAVRSRAPGVPTIATSGLPDARVKEQMIAAGFDGWLS